MNYRENIEWCDIWVESADSTSLPRVLLVGDSITCSYYPCVCQGLKGVYACARLTSSKCVADPAFFKELELVLGEFRFSVIHFNNGLHGWGYDEGSYGAGLARAFDMLSAHCSGGHLIWGSTTPVWKEGAGDTLDEKTKRVRQRNEIAASLVADRGIQINDLFGAVVDRPEIFSKDGVHFLEPGQLLLGERVLQAIRGKAGFSGRVPSR